MNNLMSSNEHIIMRNGRFFPLPRNNAFVPNIGKHNFENNREENTVSRTYQYRKVMKPMLERKRRARINRCLDELKELMLTALQAEGENVNKLEKADILELTVKHLHKLKRQKCLSLNPDPPYIDRFRAGFTQCATEVSQYLASVLQQQQNYSNQRFIEKPPVVIDHISSVKLLQHLGSCIQRIESSTFSYDDGYTTPPASPSPNRSQDQNSSSSMTVWRPW